MKNSKFKKFFILLFFISLALSNLNAKDFEFNGKEIEILDNGNKIIGEDGIEIFLKKKKQKITANKFLYNKNTKTLTISGQVKFIDNEAELEILSDETIYLENSKNYLFSGNIIAKLQNKFFLNTNQVEYNQIENIVFSKTKTTIKDNLENNFIVSDFKFFKHLNQINLNNVIYTDNEKNEYKLDKAILDLNLNQVLGKDVAIKFNNDYFGNQKNDPRVKGASIFADNNTSTISKGVFTTCKKTDKCPPWVISAAEVKHDKKKQQLQYKNAWLEIYDQPVLFFPKFFHPDSTVKRQSGFLMPQFSNSNSLGSSFYLPYYKVLSNHNDLTFKPRIYSNEAILFQGEYRHVTKKTKNIIDTSFLKKQSFKISNNDTTSHFFSNSTIGFDLLNFSETNLEINLQNTSNDTYLKTYKIDSPLIKNSSSLNSYINMNGSNEKTTFNISMEVYEDLTKKIDSDKYTYLYPSFDIQTELNNNFELPGTFTLNFEGYQKKYNTNSYDGVLINDLLYSNSQFDKKGFKNDINILLKNVNSSGKNSLNFKNDENTQLLPKASYKLSYPLTKKDVSSNNFLTPLASVNYSPTNDGSLIKNDTRIDINNVFSFNRIGVSDTVESGLSLSLGTKYRKEFFNSNRYFNFNIAQNYRYKENNDLPTNGSIDKKSSDIFTNIEYNLNEYLNFKYDFNLNRNFEKTNFDSISTRFSLKNFTTTFEYLDNKKSIDANSFLSNKTSLIINENNTFSFGTRKNRKINLTEYYDLIYEYKNDCLEAGIAYKKEYYNDNDLKPEEQIYFTLTVMPFGKIKSPGLK